MKDKPKTPAVKILMVLLVLLLCSANGIKSAWASSTTSSHQVTIQVPEILSIDADISGFTLSFDDFLKDSVTNTQTVQYTVKSNFNQAAQGAIVVKAKLTALFTSIDFLAKVGVYAKAGGNASLRAVSANPVKILTSDTNLARKIINSGNGHILRGTFPIEYQALAKSDLASGTQNANLTITFTDI